VPATAATKERRRGARPIVVVAVVALVLAGLAVVAASIGGLTDSGRIGEQATDAPAAAEGLASTTRASPLAPTPQASPRAGTAPMAVLNVDLHPIGPPDPDELPITRVVGSVEIAAFPTAFDRSLRFAGTVAGLCVQRPPSQEAAISVAFDLHLGEAGAGGRLHVTMDPAPAVPAIGLVVELEALAGLDQEAWHRLVVTGDGEGGGRLEVTPVGSDRPVLDAELGLDPTVAPASSDETCVHASLASSDAAVFLDNLQVDR
jgi:hypothetical protein